MWGLSDGARRPGLGQSESRSDVQGQRRPAQQLVGQRNSRGRWFELEALARNKVEDDHMYAAKARPQVNPHGSLDTTLTVTFRTRLSAWNTKGIVADQRTHMGGKPLSAGMAACGKLRPWVLSFPSTTFAGNVRVPLTYSILAQFQCLRDRAPGCGGNDFWCDILYRHPHLVLQSSSRAVTYRAGVPPGRGVR